MELTTQQKQDWESWLNELPENVKKVAKKIVPWKKYIDTRIEEDCGNRYSPVLYEENEDGSVTVTCAKSNEEFLIFGGYNVFGMNPDNLQEDN